MHSLDVIQDPRNLERAYEDSLKNRPSPVTNSGGSIARGAPVIVPEPGKPHQSALSYEDHQAGHGTAFGSHLHRGSPVSTRESTPRQHEGTWQSLYWMLTSLEGLQEVAADPTCLSCSQPVPVKPVLPSTLLPLLPMAMADSQQWGGCQGQLGLSSLPWSAVRAPHVCTMVTKGTVGLWLVKLVMFEKHHPSVVPGYPCFCRQLSSAWCIP